MGATYSSGFDLPDLKCPNCGTVFQIDEVDYMSIVKQVKDKEFETQKEQFDLVYK